MTRPRKPSTSESESSDSGITFNFKLSAKLSLVLVSIFVAVISDPVREPQSIHSPDKSISCPGQVEPGSTLALPQPATPSPKAEITPQ